MYFLEIIWSYVPPKKINKYHSDHLTGTPSPMWLLRLILCRYQIKEY